MPKFAHVEWKGVEFAPGSYTVTGYDESGAVVGTKTVKTTGKPTKLSASIRDGVGATLYAGCGDMALVQELHGKLATKHQRQRNHHQLANRNKHSANLAVQGEQE